jgi:protein-S-isoprenylcysteine O-methyltransferase Ste14
MSQALVPLVATVAFAFVVHRWVADELGRERRLSAGAGVALVALFVLLTSLVLVTALGGVERVHAGDPVAVGLGVLLTAGGVALAGGAVWALASRERLLAKRFDAVVSTGPYRYGRHPFYLGWTAALLGMAIAGGTGVGLTISLLVGIALAGVARGEERFLIEELGREYECYRRRTPALIGRPKGGAAVPVGD